VVAAKDYQHNARKEFFDGANRKAVNTSYIARRLAFRAYHKNTGNSEEKEEWKLTDHEQKLVTITVTPAMIDEILEEYSPEDEKNEELEDLDDLTPEDADDENETNLEKNDKGKQQSNTNSSKGKSQK